MSMDMDAMYHNAVNDLEESNAGIAVEDGGDDEAPITEEDAWTVISSHFATRGLVSQQLDSFDVFMCQTMQVSYFKRSLFCCELRFSM